MSDTIPTGATWRRELKITDASGPISPTDMTVTLAPAVPIGVTEKAVGVFELLLTDTQTKGLPIGNTFYEIWGRISGDLLYLANIPITVVKTLHQ